MFECKSFIIKTIIIWSVVNVVLVECIRQKKDVHHMIFLNDDSRPSKRHKHTNHVHGPRRSKRKPSRPPKHTHSSSFEETEANVSLEEFSTHKPISKRPRHKPNSSHKKSHHKRHKDHKPRKNHHKHEHHHKSKNQGHHHDYSEHHHHHEVPKDNQIYPPSDSIHFPEGKWTPMTSQEFFGSNSPIHAPPAFTGGYRTEASPHPSRNPQYSQPMPIEITTPLSMPSNSFFSFESSSTSYPPLNSAYDINSLAPQNGPPFVGTAESYKPFDYSVLRHPPSEGMGNAYAVHDGSPVDVLKDDHVAESVRNALSIIMESSDEDKAKEQQENLNKEQGQTSKKSNKKRARGSSRFGLKRKNKN